MLQLKTGDFYWGSANLMGITQYIGGVNAARTYLPADAYHGEVDAGDRRELQKDLTELREHLKALGARVTLLAVDNIKDMLRVKGAMWSLVKPRLEEIVNTLQRELSLMTVIVLEHKEQSYFEPKDPHFGTDVGAKFQASAVFEVDEAAKCLALGRSTAAVFHLMRVMEIGIRAVARCLQIPDPVRGTDRNWGNILREIKTDLDAHVGHSPAKTWTVTGDKEFFESVYVSLDAVRVGWRNPTMHVENKYTDHEAQHIFVAVRGFMMKLASRCDEKGDPKA
jgi:hypothetical protein